VCRYFNNVLLDREKGRKVHCKVNLNRESQQEGIPALHITSLCFSAQILTAVSLTSQTTNKANPTGQIKIMNATAIILILSLFYTTTSFRK